MLIFLARVSCLLKWLLQSNYNIIFHQHSVFLTFPAILPRLDSLLGESLLLSGHPREGLGHSICSWKINVTLNDPSCLLRNMCGTNHTLSIHLDLMLIMLILPTGHRLLSLTTSQTIRPLASTSWMLMMYRSHGLVQNLADRWWHFSPKWWLTILATNYHLPNHGILHRLYDLLMKFRFCLITSEMFTLKTLRECKLLSKQWWHTHRRSNKCINIMDETCYQNNVCLLFKQ